MKFIESDTGEFTLEHLTDSEENRRLICNFASGNNAFGLEQYLKDLALEDENLWESRTYLVKDSFTRDLACYFSLRTCLVPLSIGNGKFFTVPGVELANFAVNEAYRQAEREKGRVTKKIGAYVFSQFILPISRHVAEFVGAKWLCIYAIPEAKLLEYYSRLGFRRLDRQQEDFVYGHVKPEYDQNCIFMYQSIKIA